MTKTLILDVFHVFSGRASIFSWKFIKFDIGSLILRIETTSEYWKLKYFALHILDCGPPIAKPDAIFELNDSKDLNRILNFRFPTSNQFFCFQKGNSFFRGWRQVLVKNRLQYSTSPRNLYSMFCSIFQSKLISLIWRMKLLFCGLNQHPIGYLDSAKAKINNFDSFLGLLIRFKVGEPRPCSEGKRIFWFSWEQDFTVSKYCLTPVSASYKRCTSYHCGTTLCPIRPKFRLYPQNSTIIPPLKLGWVLHQKTRRKDHLSLNCPLTFKISI